MEYYINYPEFLVMATVPGGGVLILRLPSSALTTTQASLWPFLAPSSSTFFFFFGFDNNPSLTLAFSRANPPRDAPL